MARSSSMWKSVARIGALVVIGGGALWVATFGSFHQEVRQSIAGGYPMPGFTLPVLEEALFEGDTTHIRFEDLRGKVVLLSFWATWCAPCIAEQPSLLALQDEFGADGLEVLGVLHEDRARYALDWLVEHDRTAFRVVVGTVHFGRAARVGGLPHTLLVGRDGVVSDVFAGYWQERDAYVRERVQELLEASPST